MAPIVTKFCLGTMTFGAESDEATSHKLLDDYAKAGGNFIDTADVYSTGVSEMIIGKWLKGHPTESKQMVLATKARFPMGRRAKRYRHFAPTPERSARRLLAPPRVATDRSLSNARMGRVDPDRRDPAIPRRRDRRRQDRLLRFLELSRLARHEGVRACQGARMGGTGDAATAIQPARARDRTRNRAGLHRRWHGLLPWSPLGGGWLSGKYKRDVPPTGATRLGENPNRGMEAYAPRNAQERTWTIIDAVGKIAKARGVGLAQVALAWVAAQPAVTSVILGARNPDQLADNLGAASLALSMERSRRSPLSAPR